MSATAERWLPIEYVEPVDVQKYITSRKDQGYTIVGIEQVCCRALGAVSAIFITPLFQLWCPTSFLP